MIRRDADAHAETQQHQPEERSDLVVLEIVPLAVAAHHRRGNVEWIVAIENRVRDRNGQLADVVAVDHVAEVDDPRDELTAARQIVAVANEHVVVVQVAVDDRAT